jgi:hypothetical protein
MAFRFDEKPGSRRTGQNPPTYETTWVAAGEANSSIVRSHAMGATPQIVSSGEGILYRSDIVLQERGHKVFDVIVKYETQESQKPAVGNYKFSFATTGGTFHITHAREHVQSYVASGNAPQHYGAINVVKNGNGVEIQGADIIIPALKFSITFSHPLGIVNLGHARNLARLTGSVNSDVFFGFAAGEVIFLGAEGGDGSAAEAEVNYHFACEENLEGLTYQNGTITGVAKQGHDLLWVESEPNKDGNDNPVAKIIAVHIERPYKRANLKAALGFG